MVRPCYLAPFPGLKVKGTPGLVRARGSKPGITSLPRSPLKARSTEEGPCSISALPIKSVSLYITPGRMVLGVSPYASPGRRLIAMCVRLQDPELASSTRIDCATEFFIDGTDHKVRVIVIGAVPIRVNCLDGLLP